MSCALLDAMARAFGGPRGDALGRLFLLLERVAGQARDGEVGLSYLLRCVSADRVDAIRRESGRARCGACSAYGWSSRRCLARDTPYIDELRPDTEPSQLTPACTSFRSVHAAGADPEVLDRPSSGNRAVSERVLGALEILERSDATAAALLVEHYLSGRSLRDVSRATGVARRRLTAELRRAERLLGAILEDLP